MQKTYVLDTNVLIQAPHALLSFEDNRIVIPVPALEELDGLKNEEGERGANARQVIRYLENLRQNGDLLKGVVLPNGGSVRLEINHVDVKLPEGWREHSPDNRILKICKGLVDQGENAILVTKDIMARIKAQMIHISSEDFTTDQVASVREQYSARMNVYAADALLENFRTDGMELSDLYTVNAQGEAAAVPPIPNLFLIIHSELHEKKTVLGRISGNRIVPLEYINTQPFGVVPRNVGQRFMQEALLLSAEQAPLVIVKGTAGTAKTFFCPGRRAGTDPGMRRTAVQKNPHQPTERTV